MKKPIYVTKPSLPPIADLIPYLEEIWERKVLTNGGPIHQKLEQELCNYLSVDFISLFTNGTNALLTAIQSMGLTGEVITTPYSFVATSNALLWNNLTPVFVDIDPLTLNLDPQKIEHAITDRTTAILPVHCYGNPCDVEKIEEIANINNLKIIYDAAHAFGVKKNSSSILSYGDLSVLSFHATKVFNTFEGGAIVSKTADAKEHIDRLKNFGIIDELNVSEPGMNGKMSELNAAIGLLQLKQVSTAINAREAVDRFYREGLSEVVGITIPQTSDYVKSNYSYFPILIESNFPVSRDGLFQLLKDDNIFSRRYFYPLISDFPLYKKFASSCHANLPVAVDVANKVLCLPIYPDLGSAEQKRVIDLIRRIANGNARYT